MSDSSCPARARLWAWAVAAIAWARFLSRPLARPFSYLSSTKVWFWMNDWALLRASPSCWVPSIKSYHALAVWPAKDRREPLYSKLSASNARRAESRLSASFPHKSNSQLILSPEVKLLLVNEVLPLGKLKPIRFRFERLPVTSARAVGRSWAPNMVACSPLAINRSLKTSKSGLLTQACSMTFSRGAPPSVRAQPDSERLDSREVALDSQYWGGGISNVGFLWTRGRVHPTNKNWLKPVKIKNMIIGFILLEKSLCR